MRCQRRELVGRGRERKAGQLGNLGRTPHTEIRRGIETGSDSGTPNSQLVQFREDPLDALHIRIELRDEARELLSQRQRYGVLQMSTPDLHYILELFLLPSESVPQFADLRDQTFLDDLRRRDVHGGRESVVGRLGHVDVIVGMDGILAP